MTVSVHLSTVKVRALILVLCLAHACSYAQAPGTVLWTFPTFGQVVSSPAIAPDGTIYLAGYYLYALRPDGTNKWTAQVGANHSSPAVAADGTVYVGSFLDGRLYALGSKG